MKRVQLSFTMFALILTGSLVSCKEAKKEAAETPATETHEEMHEGMHQEGDMHHEDGGDMHSETGMTGKSNKEVAGMVNAYLELKNALVASDKEAAATAAMAFVDAGAQLQLDNDTAKKLLDETVRHGEQLAGSDLEGQRKHFKAVSEAMSKLLTTVGTSQPLYQQYCPMYNKNEGGMWLSSEKEIRNPYFGDKMLKCGMVQKEIL